MFVLKILLFITFLSLNSIESAKILGLFTIPSKSHTILAYELFKELAKSGHKVVVIQPDGNELKNPPANYTNIVIGGEIIEIFRRDHMDKVFDQVDLNPITTMTDLLQLAASATDFIITHPKTKALLSSKIKFDLVISEISLNDALFGFSEHYGCPHILISTLPATSWIETMTGSPAPSSYVPNVFLDLTDNLNFFDRVQNTIFNFAEKILFHFYHYPLQRKIYENSFENSKNFRKFWDRVKRGSSLTLMNSHFTINYPRPFMPNTIEVAGMHIKKTTNPLPKDIQEFIDNSKGVVYFSLGGNIKPSQMPIEKQQAIINALSKVKNERILWKWDDENVKVDRKKFLVKKWFPQDEILAHPKVKVFITHGGLLGGTEAIYNGKPLITIPIFGDQKLNAARSVLNGFGVRVDYNNLTEESLTWALDEILKNQKYSNKVKELSMRFKEKPIHPLDLAKFYIEYVIRHKGASFMQSSATQLNFIELNNIDVIIFIVVVFIILILIPLLILGKLFKFIFSSSKPQIKKKRN